MKTGEEGIPFFFTRHEGFVETFAIPKNSKVAFIIGPTVTLHN